VSDSGGVPREAATVRATNNATGVTRSTTTRADGAYTITGLSSGTYTVSATFTPISAAPNPLDGDHYLGSGQSTIFKLQAK